MKNLNDDLDEQVTYAGSLYAFLQRHRPDLTAAGTRSDSNIRIDALSAAAHGTTILAFRYASGVVIGSDTQVTAGHTITGYMNKVIDISSHLAIAISGTVGIAQDISDHLRVEVTYYERINHARLSPQGTANALGRMIKANFAAIGQGLICIPILAAYDLRMNIGKVFSYDVIGALYETEYHTGGSGGDKALSTLEQKWTPELSKDQAVSLAVDALVNASRSDTATTAVDEENDIYPIVKVIDREGILNVPDPELREIYHSIKKNSPPKRKVRSRGA